MKKFEPVAFTIIHCSRDDSMKYCILVLSTCNRDKLYIKKTMQCRFFNLTAVSVIVFHTNFYNSM